MALLLSLLLGTDLRSCVIMRLPKAPTRKNTAVYLSTKTTTINNGQSLSNPKGINNVKDIASEKFVNFQSLQLQLDSWKIRRAISLLQEGCTVPFIARYRHLETGNVTCESLFHIQRSLEAFITLDKTRQNRITKLRDKGVSDDKLLERFESCLTMQELDELWEPFKDKKSNKSQLARNISGLEDLATNVLNGKIYNLSPTQITLPVDSELTVIEGITAIITDVIAHDPDNKSLISKLVQNSIIVEASFTVSMTEEDRAMSKYFTYHNFKKFLTGVAPHQLLALRRGKDAGELAVKIAPTENSVSNVVSRLLSKYKISSEESVHKATLSNPHSRESVVGTSVLKAVKKSLLPSLEKHLWKDKLVQSEEAAVSVFMRNLRHLLLTPPLAAYAPDVRIVAGLDPGYSHGHKFVIVAVGGSKILARDKLYWDEKRTRSDTVNKLREYCRRHEVNLIAIGDGIGSQNAQEMVAEALLELPNVKFAVVSEAGASVYSASKVAKQEFPAEEISFLGSISIARRLIDPLSEIVKIPPASMGVGMYQHDIDEHMLERRLGEVVEECISEVGADVNTASEHVLKFVSGMNEARAKAVIDYRNENGPFQDRKTLMNVKGIGSVTFKNVAGFLRVRGGSEVLDSTCVHPEYYSLARRLLTWAASQSSVQLKDTDYGSAAIKETLSKIDLSAASVALVASVDLLECILTWLSAQPGDGEGDIRAVKGEAPPLVNSTTELCNSTHDVAVGAYIIGVVKNLAEFGVFIDIGRGQCGLLHKSECGDLRQYAVGQRVSVKVINVDEKRKRVSLGLAKRADIEPSSGTATTLTGVNGVAVSGGMFRLNKRRDIQSTNEAYEEGAELPQVHYSSKTRVSTAQISVDGTSICHKQDYYMERGSKRKKS